METFSPVRYGFAPCRASAPQDAMQASQSRLVRAGAGSGASVGADCGEATSGGRGMGNSAGQALIIFMQANKHHLQLIFLHSLAFSLCRLSQGICWCVLTVGHH